MWSVTASLFSIMLIQALPSMAQTKASLSSAASAIASSSYNVFSAIAWANPGDGTYGNQPGSVDSDPSNQAGQNAAGASGGSDDSLNIGTGATIAIGVGVGAVVLLGVTTAVLFFLAKKRRWEVGKALRKSMRRVTSAVRPRRPRTPKAPMTSRSSRTILRIDPPRSGHPQVAEDEKTPILESHPARDIELGYPRRPAIHVTPNPQSSFDMDSPALQSKGWTKVFGRTWRGYFDTMRT